MTTVILELWATVPSDVLGSVFNKLDGRDCKAVRLTCRSWARVLDEHLSSLKPKALQEGSIPLFNRIGKLDLTCCKLEDGQIRLPFSQLQTLSVKSSRDLHRLDLSKLQQLEILGDASRDGLDSILGSNSLTQLTITDWKSFGSHLLALMVDSLPNIKCLYLDRQSVWSMYHQPKIACQTISKLSRLEGLTLGTLLECTEESLAALGCLTALTELSFVNTGGLNSTGLSSIAKLSALKRLQILDSRGTSSVGCCLTAGDIAPISSLAQLQDLTIRSCRWDNVLPGMSLLTGLTSLDISNSKLLSVGAALESFPLDKLRSICLNNSRCHLLDLTILRRAADLSRLAFVGCIQDSSFLCVHEQVLKDLIHLKSLSISSSSCTQSVLRDGTSEIAQGLGELTSLEWSNETPFLWAWDMLESKPSGIGCLLQHASHLTSLKRLCIPDQHLMPTHATLANLGRITSLTELDLSSTRCEQDEDFDNLLGSLDQLTALRTLNLSCTCVHSKGLASIGKLEALTSLDLSCIPFEENSLSLLIGLSRLRKLTINNWKLEVCLADADMGHIASLATLESLSLRDNWHISNEGLATLYRLPRLAFLDVRGCFGIHSETALQQSQSCTTLAELWLSEPGNGSKAINSDVSAVTLQALRDNLPFLRTVTLGGQVMTSRTACTMAKVHFRVSVLGNELARLCLSFIDIYEAALAKRKALTKSLLTEIGIQKRGLGMISEKNIQSYIQNRLSKKCRLS